MNSISNGVSDFVDLVVRTLKIGSPEKRTGITFYDEVTGEPYCLSIANGEQKVVQGECGIFEPATSDTELETTPPPAPLLDQEGDGGGNSEPDSTEGEVLIPEETVVEEETAPVIEEETTEELVEEAPAEIVPTE